MRKQSFQDWVPNVDVGNQRKRPGMGRLRDELAVDLRSFPVGRYVIFFRPLSNGVNIVRVLHSARDLNADFFAEEDD